MDSQSNQKYNNKVSRQQKLKYKHKKHVPEHKDDKIKKQISLPSNWSRYEISEEQELEPNNFQLLSEKQVSHESYFTFKNEQSWSDSVEIHSQFSKYFTINLKFLDESVASIPFHENHEIDSEFLSTLHINKFNHEAESNSNMYYSNNFSNENLPSQINEKKDEEQLIQATESKLKVEDSKTEDLEQWLDNILDN